MDNWRSAAHQAPGTVVNLEEWDLCVNRRAISVLDDTLPFDHQDRIVHRSVVIDCCRYQIPFQSEQSQLSQSVALHTNPKL